MPLNVVGLFDSQAQADNAVRGLIAEGILPGKISVIAADPSGRIKREMLDRSGDITASGAATGAASGLVVGGLVGLLVGTMSIAAPPVGIPIGILVGGPLAGFLGGAGLGVISGGLLGAIIGLGVSESDANIYAESIRRGGTVLTVEVDGSQRDMAESIIAQAGAVSLTERGALYRREGFVRYDPSAPIYTEAEVAAELARVGATPLTTLQTADVIMPAEEVTIVSESDLVPVGMDSVFEQHFEASEKGISGMTYDQLRPAYRYGYELAEMPEYRNRPWAEVQPGARKVWEDRNPGTWERASSAIRFGWSCLAPASAIGTDQVKRPLAGEPEVL